MQKDAFGFRTDNGMQRDGNEDALLLLPKYGIFAVADGVGGQNSGEIASSKAMSVIEGFLESNPIAVADMPEGKNRETWLKNYFQRCLQKANSEIIKEASSDPVMNRMATTLVLAFFEAESLYITNVGDSRAYLLRDGVMTQLTEDHSYVNKLINAGKLTKSEARSHPQKNIITKALGSAKNPEPDFYHFDLKEGDRLMLCTDGLHGELTDDEIAVLLKKKRTLDTICRMLVDAANENGGRDNITVICVDNK